MEENHQNESTEGIVTHCIHNMFNFCIKKNNVILFLDNKFYFNLVKILDYKKKINIV